jgi:adenylosuccinate lyase
MHEINMSEAVMMQLAKKVGRQQAHEIVRTAAMKAYESGEKLTDALLNEPVFAQHFTRAQLDWMVKPENYVGTAVQQVDYVIELLKQNQCQE